MSTTPLRLLFVTRHAPLPGEHGSGAYVFDLLRFLASSGFEITCLWVHEGLNGNRGWCAVPAEADAVYDLRVPGYWRLGRWLVRPRLLVRSVVRKLVRLLHPPRKRRGSAAWNRPASPKELEAVRTCALETKPDLVLANYYWMTGAFAQAPTAVAGAVLSHDVFHQRGADMRSLGVSVNAGEISAEDEAAQLGRAQLVIAITEEDAATFRPLLPESEVLVASKSAQPVVDSGAAAIPGRCLFVGGESPPNVDGIQWFLDEVWPAVLASNPTAELHLCGRVCERLDSARLPERCVLRGLVASLAEEYAAAQVVLVPLRAGSGLKIKFVEALAHGCACVSTSVGLQGLPFVRHGFEAWRADSAADFARGVSRLLESEPLRKSLREAGLAAVETHLSPSRTYGPLAARLRELAARPETSPPLAHAR